MRSKGGDIQAFIKKVVQQVDVAVLYGEVADCIVTYLVVLPHGTCLSLFEDAVLAAAMIGSQYQMQMCCSALDFQVLTNLSPMRNVEKVSLV